MKFNVKPDRRHGIFLDLARRDVSVYVVGDDLILRGDTKRIGSTLLGEVRAWKSQIHDDLTQDPRRFCQALWLYAVGHVSRRWNRLFSGSWGPRPMIPPDDDDRLHVAIRRGILAANVNATAGAVAEWLVQWEKLLK